MIRYAPALLFVLFFSCIRNVDSPAPVNVMGYVPVYGNHVAELKKISAGPARPSVKGGKMYTVGTLLYQVEPDSGIHVINYADPANPQKLGFIRSFLCKEISVKNGFIYTNNLSDLVVIDARAWNNVREIARIEKVFPDLDNQFPEKINPDEIVYFECPDPFKGVVVGWKEQIILEPKCWR